MSAKYQKIVAFAVLAFLLLAFLPASTSAAGSANLLKKLEDAGGSAGAGYDTAKKDPAVAVANVVEVFLGLLAIIFLVLMIYAGYLWMTASGSEEKIGKAKHILINATIGLAIILAAYALTWFVFEYFRTAGGGVGGGGNTGGTGSK